MAAWWEEYPIAEIIIIYHCFGCHQAISKETAFCEKCNIQHRRPTQ